MLEVLEEDEVVVDVIGTTTVVVVLSVTVEVDVEVVAPATTAVCACCPLPRTVTMYFCPATMLCVGVLPWNHARPPMVIGPV